MYRQSRAITCSLWAIANLLGAGTLLIWAYGMHLTSLPLAVFILVLSAGALLAQGGRMAKQASYHWARFKGPLRFNLNQSEEKATWIVALCTVFIILAYVALIHISKR